MALITYPLNNVLYTAEDAELFHVTRTSGVYANDSFDYSVTGADNTIVIGSGIGWIKNSEFSGKVIAQKSPVSIDMGLPDSIYPRIDAIVIQFNANTNETNIVAKKGTAASSPAAPSVVRTESVYELHLYHVRREAGSTSISPSAVTDLRLSEAYCGIMADSVTHVDTSAIWTQIESLIADADERIGQTIDDKLREAKNSGEFDGPAGPQGPQGPAGQSGANGEDGKSAFQAAFDGGFLGTETVFNQSLAELPGHLDNDIRHITSEERTSWSGKASTVTYPATVTTTWKTSGSYRYQDITVNGILATDNPVVDIVPGSDNAANVLYAEAICKVFRITTSANSIRVWAKEVITTAFPIQLKVVR